MEKPIRDLGKILAPALFKISNSSSASDTVGYRVPICYIPNFIQIGLTVWPLDPRTYTHTHTHIHTHASTHTHIPTHRHFSKTTFLDSGDLKDHMSESKNINNLGTYLCNRSGFRKRWWRNIVTILLLLVYKHCLLFEIKNWDAKSNKTINFLFKKNVLKHFFQRQPYFYYLLSQINL